MATLINKTPDRRVQYKIDANKTEIMFPNLECLSAALLRDLLPSGSTPAGDSAYITDASDLVPVESLKVNIQAVQTGTGDPSPENVRPISGWDSIKVTVTNGKQSTDPDYVSQEHAIPLGRTVYGGTLDVTTGELVVTWAMTTIGALSWSYDSQYTRFSCGIQGMLTGKYGTRQVPLYSSQYYNVKDGRPIGDVPNYAIYGSGSGAFVYITDSRYTDASAFKSANADVPIVYELATPQTYTLTPQQVTLLKGINNISADAGTVEVKYSADIQLYIDKQIAELQALVLEN